MPVLGALPVFAVALALPALTGCGRGEPEPGRQVETAAAASAPGTSPTPAGSPAATPGAPAAPEPTATVTLYFADDQGRLRAEKRELPSGGAPADRARRLVQALLDGPQSKLTAVMPPDVSLRALYLGDDGTAYVDFDAGFTRGLNDGSEDALLAVQSLADTLAGNLAEVQRVRILVEGEEVRELGGHLDLSRPFGPTETPS